MGDKESPEVRDFQFTVALYGGRLAIIRTPVPISKRNLDRLKRIIGDQLEPLLESPEPLEASAGADRR